MTAKKRKFGLALMLLTASVLALYPTMSLEKPQQQNGFAVVSIKASGQAFANNKVKSSTVPSNAALTLYGSVEAQSRGELKINDLGGSLQIGTANYTVASGSGVVKKKNTIEINAKTSDATKTLELILHGESKGNNVTFNSKESKLSSLYFLSLKGQAIVTMPPTTNSSATQNSNHETTTLTVTQTATETIFNTLTVTGGNQTVTQTVQYPEPTQQ
jgi:hypothetical protein